MAIFQKSVIKKHLNNLDKEEVENAYLKFKKNYNPAKIEQIKTLKEEEYQDGFLRDIFVDVFGYTLRPNENYNLQREFKNQSDGKKADGAILKDGKAIAVIELKSTKTKDLYKVTQQAFNYKNNQPECKYVITSNFQKLRFYIDYANEYEEFDLFYLEKEDFELLYLLLNKNSIFDNIPLKLKEETKFHEQEVSSKLYKDYSHFKRKLYENLTKNHPESDKLTLFKKSQKLLDRFLFILFSEDSGLLPPNSISRVIETYYKLIELDAKKPLYKIFKQYFGYMNIGRKGKTSSGDIPAYNGGLFYTDTLLDNLKIDDNILIDDLRNLSKYDFNTEVDVNILGHIFEHSLNEIEEITAEIEGTTADKAKSKRKKDGVFYTPKYITQYIVENTIGTLCNEKRIALKIEEIEFDGTFRTKTGKLSEKGKKLYSQLKEYKDWLISLKIIDPACGSGAFLNQALNFLIEEHTIIDDIIAELTNTPLRLFDVDKSILENNLFGVDINEESVEIAQLSLWLRTAQKGRKLSNLNNNIKCGNSLIDDPEIAGDKAFDWNIEFAAIMDNGGFDCVIGNPPYGADLDGKDWLKSKYEETSFGNIDSYKYFVQLGSNLTKNECCLGYIMPDSYLEKEYFKDLRIFTSKNFKDLTNIKLGDDVFDDVNLPTAIIFLYNKGIEAENFKFLDISKIYKEKKSIALINSPNFITERPRVEKTFVVVNNIIKSSNIEKLIDVYNQVMGVKVYQKGKGKPKQTAYQKDNDVFVSEALNEEFNYPYISQGINRYFYNTQNEYISYGEWLAEPRKIEYFDNPKLVIREIINPRIFATYIEEPAIVKNIAAVIIEKNTDYPIKFLLGLINSKLLTHHVNEQSPKSSNKSYPSFNSRLLKELPIIKCERNKKDEIIKKVDFTLNKTTEIQTKSKRFIKRVTDKFEIEKISKKLSAFYNFDFKTYVAELKKQKVSLSLKQQDEWQDYFESYKTEINQLQNEIQQTDNEIDKMVYELYGLNDEEINVVEGS